MLCAPHTVNTAHAKGANGTKRGGTTGSNTLATLREEARLGALTVSASRSQRSKAKRKGGGELTVSADNGSDGHEVLARDEAEIEDEERSGDHPVNATAMRQCEMKRTRPCIEAKET
jgi:hypothetical protein